MKKSRIFGFCAIVFCIVLIIGLFVPFYSGDYSDSSLWDLEAPVRIPLLIGAILMILIFLVNIRTEISYLFSGIGFFFGIEQIITVSDSYYDMGIYGAGFYLIFISSIFLIILTFVMNFKIFDSKIGGSQKKSMPVYPTTAIPMPSQAMPVHYQNEAVGYDSNAGKTIVGYNPMTGEPIFEQKVEKPKIVGYDPENGKPIVGYDSMTGRPIYLEQ